MKKTKIICTIGPASQSKKVIWDMTSAGCDVIRLNFSHGTHEDYAEKIKTILLNFSKKSKKLSALFKKNCYNIFV